MVVEWRVSSAGCRGAEPAEDATEWSVAWLVYRVDLKQHWLEEALLTPKHCGLQAADTHGLYEDDGRQEKWEKNEEKLDVARM